MSLKLIKSSIEKLANPQRATILQKFFKTQKGQYAEGDIFAGLTNPEARLIAKQNKMLPYNEISQLIQSEIHEERFIALVILVNRFKKEEKIVYDFYMEHLDYVNNWDLVDWSSYNILGNYLLNHPSQNQQILFQLASDKNLWRRRIAMISTMAFIKNKQFELTMKIAKKLLDDKHDLIHKATGWMLRQVGKQDQKLLTDFLKEHYDEIPRTTLRYAIEKFEEKKRKRFLNKAFK